MTIPLDPHDERRFVERRSLFTKSRPDFPEKLEGGNLFPFLAKLQDYLKANTSSPTISLGSWHRPDQAPRY